MIADRTPGLGAVETDSTHAHVPSKTLRPLKAAGVIGYVLVVAAVALLAVTLAASAQDIGPWPWAVATAVTGVVGIVCLVGVRIALVRHPAHDRPQHDPLIPEITEEEATEYEQRHDRS